MVSVQRPAPSALLANAFAQGWRILPRRKGMRIHGGRTNPISRQRRKKLGTGDVSTFSGADGDRDMMIDQDDLRVYALILHKCHALLMHF